MSDDSKGTGGFLVGGFLVLLVITALFRGGPSPSTRPMTEREKNEATTGGYFKQKYPDVPDRDIDNLARRVADEWEPAK